MVPYVSPALYRALGYGAVVTSDADLYAQLSGASTLVNRHCNQHREYDFRGGLVAGEEHQWDTGSVYARGTQRVWPDRRPVLTCESFQIKVTNTQHLDVPVQNLFVNTTSNYIEPVIAASSIGVWSYSAVPIAGLRIPVAIIDYTYGYAPLTAIRELMFVDATDERTFHAYNEWWTTTEPSLWDADGVELDRDGGEYTWDADRGTVRIADAVTLNAPYTVTYNYKLPSEIRDATAQVATQLGGNAALAAAGMLGLSGMKVEEVELRQSRDSQAAKQDITGLAAVLLEPYRWKGFA